MEFARSCNPPEVFAGVQGGAMLVLGRADSCGEGWDCLLCVVPAKGAGFGGRFYCGTAAPLAELVHITPMAESVVFGARS